MVKEKFDFDKKPSVEDKFEEKSVIDILNNVPYNHIKAEEPMLNRLYKTCKQLKQNKTGKRRLFTNSCQP